MGIRLIGGQLGGRVLRVPPGSTVRPTPDRVRESLFSALGDVWGGRSVLDLYAGSGCLAFESLSRGAARATLVERDPRVVRVLADNAATLGVADRVQIVRAEARRALARFARAGVRFDAVWLDPPYAGDELPYALATLPRAGLLAPGALVIAEHPAKAALPEMPSPGLVLPSPVLPRLVPVDARRYGDTAVTVYRFEEGLDASDERNEREETPE